MAKFVKETPPKRRHFMKFEKEKYFSCYSPKLKEFLEEFDFEPIEVFRNINTGKTCWVYEKDDKIGIYLTMWTKNKNN